MDKQQENSSHKATLHIFPDTIQLKRIVKEHHVFHNFKHKKCSSIAVKVKNVTKSYKKRLSSTPRKYPRSLREHTDLDKYSHVMTCPNCLSYIKTDVHYYNTRATHATAASLSLICMCMIPYWTTKFKDAAHYCPTCKIYLGTKFGSGKDIFFC